MSIILKLFVPKSMSWISNDHLVICIFVCKLANKNPFGLLSNSNLSYLCLRVIRAFSIIFFYLFPCGVNVNLRWAFGFFYNCLFSDLYCSISCKIELNPLSEIELFSIAFENNQVPVVRRPISANPRLNFNVGFFIPLFKYLFWDNVLRSV